MTVQELLNPRYKVIADYPNNPFGENNVLNIIPLRRNQPGFRWAEHDGMHEMSEQEMQEYPHLFRKLEWWEERSESEMPGYLKYKTTSWLNNILYVVYPAEFTKEKDGWTVKVENHIIPHGNYLRDKLPATREEYETYQKSQPHTIK